MRGMKGFKLALIYYISSMMPMYLFLIISLDKFKLYKSIEIICFTVFILIVIWIIIALYLLRLMKKAALKYERSDLFEVSELRQVNEGVIQVIFTYASPSVLNTFTSNLWLYLFGIIILNILIFYLYYNSTSYLQNITLFLSRYNFYQNKDGKILFSKSKRIRNNSESIKVLAISDFIYMED